MKAVLKGIAFVIAIVACFGFGFGWRDIKSHKPVNLATFTRAASPMAPQEVTPERIFKDAYTNILANYYRPLVPKNLTYAGISGMMASLGDPHTLFLPPVAAKQFDSDTQGQFVGIGAQLDRDPLGARVAAVFDDGPAYAAGLRSGDIITAVDGKSVAGQPVMDIVQKIRGQEGTTVRLGILKPKAEHPEIVPIKRRKINTPTVVEKYLDEDQIGYMTIRQFAEPTTIQFDAALDKLSEKPLKGLVIDLRDNPGGLLETDVELLSRFVENKVVVKIKSRDGMEETPRTLPGLTRKFPYPIALLVNEDTASAAEIFSGALRDYKLGTLVGNHTYGKASVQNIWHLRDGSSAKITIGRYFLPSGDDIGRKVDDDGIYVSGGMEPAVKVELDPDDTSIELGNPKSDAQLQKAIEFIKSKE